MQESERKTFDGWEEFRTSLLRMCSYFGDIEELRNRLKVKIEKDISKYAEDEYKKYTVEELLHVLLEIIYSYGTKEEADKFINDNIKYTTFRVMVIDAAIEEGNYDKVVEVTLQGEEQDKKHGGLVLKWKTIRYEAYKSLGLKDKQYELAMDMLKNGNFEYYKELRDLSDDKKVLYDKLKVELRNKGTWRVSLYLKLIESENDVDAIMECVREDQRLIERYATMVDSKFHEEISSLYEGYVKEEAASTSNRSQYKGLCEVIKRFKKIVGKEKAVEVIQELMETYKRRPAMVDELSRIL